MAEGEEQGHSKTKLDRAYIRGMDGHHRQLGRGQKERKERRETRKAKSKEGR